MIALHCSGCGSTMTDAELVELRRSSPHVIACCPERKMVPAECQACAAKDAEIARLNGVVADMAAKLTARGRARG